MGYSIYVIPDVGEPVFRSGLAHAVAAMSAGKAEGRLLFRRDEAVQKIEIVVMEGHTQHLGAIDGHMMTRSNQHD